MFNANTMYPGDARPWEDLQARNEERVKVRFKVRDGAGPTAIEGCETLFNAGQEHEAVIYASDVEELHKRVETETQAVEQAQKIYQRNLDKYLQTHTKGVAAADIPREKERLTKLYTGSPQAEFYKLSTAFDDGPRGIKPVEWVEEVERYAAPQNPQLELVKQIAGQLNNNNANQALLEKLEAMEKELASLKKSKGGRPPKS